MKDLAFIRSTLCAVALLLGSIGCSGGGEVEEFTLVPSTHSIDGSITGLNGTVTLVWGGSTSILQSGTFVLADAFRTNESFTLSLQDEPLGQVCEITSTTAFNNVTDDVTGVTIECVDQNLLQVVVQDFANGAPLSGVTVAATWDAGSTNSVTNESGELVFELDEFDARVVVAVDVAGYASQAQVVLNSTTAGLRVAHMHMQAIGLSAEFDAATGITAVGDNATVTIPPNALVDADNNPYSGTVTVNLTEIDPSIEAAVQAGDYMADDSALGVAPFESFGGFVIALADEGGAPLQFAAGQTASVVMNVAAAATPPTSVTLFSFNALTGYWEDEAVAVQTPSPLFTTVIDSTGSWTLGAVYTSNPVSGCVVDTQGAPLANVRVNATGVDYIGSNRGYSDDQGLFQVPVRPGSAVLVTTGNGYQSQTLSATAGEDLAECLVASFASTTINLSWGENPRDLDTHFFGFSALDGGDDFHVDWTQRNVLVNGRSIDLDVDDTSGFGPEVVTVPQFPYQGVYRYGVHLFSGSGTIQSSPARVELNLQGATTTFVPPAGDPTECWAVFDISVNAAGVATMTPLNAWEAEDYCRNGTFPDPI